MHAAKRRQLHTSSDSVVHLCDDVLVHMLSFLDVPTLIRFRLASRRFCSLISRSPSPLARNISARIQCWRGYGSLVSALKSSEGLSERDAWTRADLLIRKPVLAHRMVTNELHDYLFLPRKKPNTSGRYGVTAKFLARALGGRQSDSSDDEEEYDDGTSSSSVLPDPFQLHRADFCRFKSRNPFGDSGKFMELILQIGNFYIWFKAQDLDGWGEENYCLIQVVKVEEGDAEKQAKVDQLLLLSGKKGKPGDDLRCREYTTTTESSQILYKDYYHQEVGDFSRRFYEDFPFQLTTPECKGSLRKALLKFGFARCQNAKRVYMRRRERDE